jgi:deoxyribodipyrimidine photolyase-like uncharacterized protein
MITVWVLGDQLNMALAAMADADPSTHRVLMVESEPVVMVSWPVSGIL